MSPKLPRTKSFQANLIKLASYSIVTAMTLGILVSTLREVSGQFQLPQSTQKSAELAEAERLDKRVLQLLREGKYTEGIPIAKKVLAIREKVLGKEHPSTANRINNLASL